MRLIVLFITICVSCASCIKNAELKEAGVVISDVQCLAQQVHSGKYATWVLYLWRTIESGKDAQVSVTYLTSVGDDPIPLTVHYKMLQSGKLYVSIDELDSFFAMELDGKVRSVVRQAEYESVNTKPNALRIVTKYSRELEESDIPLLRRVLLPENVPAR